MLKDKSLEAYAKELHSDSHVGGGSVAALNAALAASLVGMVANLTKNKEKYKDVLAEMVDIADKTDKLKDVFIAFIDEDATAFNGVLEAFKLPKTTDAEKAKRKAAVEAAYKDAIAAPLALAKSAAEVYDLVEIVLKKGNQQLSSDALIAAICLRSAVLIAILNVEINLSAMKDEEYVKRLKGDMDNLRKFANKREVELLALQRF